MMSLLKVAILGTLQGFTEFLPVSSSGHLVIGEFLLGIKNANNLGFEVLLHFATLMSIIAYFVPTWWREKNRIKENRKYIEKYIFYMFIASIPAAIVGLLFQDAIVGFFQRPSIVGLMLIFTAIILFVGSRFSIERYKTPNILIAVIVGLAQSIAIIPGISRSGMTISIALLMGLSSEESAKFSFMIAMPAIFGAFLLEFKNILLLSPEVLVVGFIFGFISGYIAIKIVFKTLLNKKFIFFAYYCFIIGLLAMFM